LGPTSPSEPAPTPYRNDFAQVLMVWFVMVTQPRKYVPGAGAGTVLSTAVTPLALRLRTVTAPPAVAAMRMVTRSTPPPGSRSRQAPADDLLPPRRYAGEVAGDVAQVAEHRLCKAGVEGSSPFVSTRNSRRSATCTPLGWQRNDLRSPHIVRRTSASDLVEPLGDRLEVVVEQIGVNV
jgi:hypothetical protein